MHTGGIGASSGHGERCSGGISEEEEGRHSAGGARTERRHRVSTDGRLVVGGPMGNIFNGEEGDDFGND
jgi:hypothetical protein